MTVGSAAKATCQLKCTTAGDTTACGTDECCYQTAETTFRCLPTGAAAADADCSVINDCDCGLTCLDSKCATL